MTKRRNRRRGCFVEAHHDHLRIRFRWRGRRRTKTLDLGDTPENREKADKLAGLVAAFIKAGRDPFQLLEGSRKEAGVGRVGPTVAEYYSRWIADKVPPLVRKAQARDYRRHITGYVLPRLGTMPVAELAPRDILGLRTELLQRGLSLKYIKNIIAGSFKAMLRDAREIDQVLSHDPFVGVRRWPRVTIPGQTRFPRTSASGS